jgi:OOP family OmpA-OmpF porin
MKHASLKNVLAALGVTSCIAVSAPALAADEGFYVGASVGVTSLDVDGGDLGLTNASFDDNDTGYKVFLGYDFNKNWGVELGYADLGQYDFTGNFGAVNVRGDIDVTAAYLTAVGTYPINNEFAVFGKLGAYYGDADATASAGTISASDSGSDTNVLFGLGVKYNFTKQFAVRGEWERFHDSDFPVDLFSVGVAFKF